ncbi:MAG: glycosyltransferase family 2 protein [Hydrogenophaga sp.]|jgi:glycosyltransferase involved in cell wall biosynthesis|nr:glycosyltransferase family 2 protein [Hydrogenophaga sp.]
MTHLEPHRPAEHSGVHIVVLLPVYNGGRFLGEQLQSILEQSVQRITILCRDDASSDDSLAVLARFATQFPQKLVLVEDSLGNLGARANFSRLMQAALDHRPHDGADGHSPTYFALADQDDVWHADKLATLVAAMQQLEAERPELPALVHSDLRVVNEHGGTIAPSMARFQGLRPDRDSFAAQLMSNTLTGCTALMNRALLERSTPVPPQSIMHDWWISLVASAFGRRMFLNQSLVDYRQHGNNTIGAKEYVKPVARRHFLARIMDDRHHAVFLANAAQAEAFAAQFANTLRWNHRLPLALARGLAVHFAPWQRVLFRILRWL